MIVERIRSRCPELTTADLPLVSRVITASERDKDGSPKKAAAKRAPPAKGAHNMEERPRGAAAPRTEKRLSQHDTQAVRARPYSGPKGWTWELDKIEPEVRPTQIKFVDLATVVARLQQQYDLDLSPPPPA